MEYTQEDCIRETKEHIAQVREFMIMFAQELLNRALAHDQSKLVSPELEIFTKYTPRLKGSTYGSAEYISFFDSMQVALKHHYANNMHHPENHSDGIKGMSLVDIVEMICDWKAATMRHDSGDINKSIEINQGRFGYSDDLKSVFQNTVRMFEEG